MSLAQDLLEQIVDLESKRDSYVRLAESAPCPDLGHQFERKVSDIDAHIQRLVRALAATPERRYRGSRPASVPPMELDDVDVQIIEDYSEFDDAKTRIRRVPTTKYREVG